MPLNTPFLPKASKVCSPRAGAWGLINIDYSVSQVLRLLYVLHALD